MNIEKLSELASLTRRRNRIDRRIAELIGRPATNGNIGEEIASAIFDIQLTGSGTTAGYDGTFRSGPFAGRTVNVKLYAQDQGILDISAHPADMYLVLVGPKSAAASIRNLPLRIVAVYLFDAQALLEELKGRRIGIATSVRRHHWDGARIFPASDDGAWKLSEDQQRLLRLFSAPSAEGAQLEQVPVTVLGVDAARGGWVAVELRAGVVARTAVFADFGTLLAEYGNSAQTIAVDIPIGLTEQGDRNADYMARVFVGPKLRSTVFPAPPLWALEAADYAEAKKRRPPGAKGISAQAFALVPKVKDVAAAIEGQVSVYEVHPEVSFRALKGIPLEWPKKTTEGYEERLELLESVGIVPLQVTPRGAGRDDVLDACVAAWSAHRIATSRARALPASATLGADHAGMTIFY